MRKSIIISITNYLWPKDQPNFAEEANRRFRINILYTDPEAIIPAWGGAVVVFDFRS